MSLTSLASVRGWMKYAANNTADDALISALIPALDARVARIIDRNLESTVYTAQRFDGPGRDELLLPHYPISALAEIAVDSGYVFASPLVYDSDYTYDANTGIVYRLGGVWPCGRRNIRVTWTAGYTTVPADVQHAADVTIAEWVTRAKQLEGGQTQSPIESEDLGDRSTAHAVEVAKVADIPKMALDCFLSYRYQC